MAEAPPTLLCTANFPAGTGYAWDFIEALYAGVADRLAERGFRTLVAYPELEAEPRTLAGSAATAILNDFRPGLGGATRRAAELARREGVVGLYMADRPVWHPGYARLRRAGVSGIVVHDHTSGERTAPRGTKRALKRLRLAFPGALADRVLAVSDFVARRKTEVDLVPAERVFRVWNSVEVDPSRTDPDPDAAVSSDLAGELGVSSDRPIVLCVGRATAVKGIDQAMAAFDAVLRQGRPGARPLFVHAGDGPALDELRGFRDGLANAEDIRLLGYRQDVGRLIDAATVCVAPSLWAEAFGLSALEPMARCRAVIASRAGGLSEVVEDGRTGLLVPPGDRDALTAALTSLLDDPERRRDFARAAHKRALEQFDRGPQLDRLALLIAEVLPGGAR